MINLKGITQKSKHHVQYPDLPSAIKPIPLIPDLPIPEPDANKEYSSDSEQGDITVIAGNDAYKPEEDDQLVPLTQAEVNGLTRYLNLSNESDQLLGSRLKEKNVC